MGKELQTQGQAMTDVMATGDRGLRLQSFDDMWRFAQMVVAGGFAPKGMERPEAVLVAVQMGMELGITPMQAIQGIAVINNRPTVWGDLAKALVDASGLCEYCKEWFEGEGEQTVAFCEVRRVNRPNPVRGRFSVADAKRAGLWGKGGTWGFYPQRMMQMRARSFCIRDAFPDVLKGMSIREEVEDYVEIETGHPPIRQPRAKEALPAPSTTQTDAPFDVAQPKPAPTKKEAQQATAAAQPPTDDRGPVIGVVEGITERRGTTNGRDWVAWFITIGGQDYGTFSESIAAVCQQDQTVRFTWQPSKKGGRELVTADPCSEAAE